MQRGPFSNSSQCKELHPGRFLPQRCRKSYLHCRDRITSLNPSIKSISLNKSISLKHLMALELKVETTRVKGPPRCRCNSWKYPKNRAPGYSRNICMCESLSAIVQEGVSGQKPGLRFTQEAQACTDQQFLTKRLPWMRAQIRRGSWGRSVAEDIRWSCSNSNPPSSSSCHECLK